jgi:hypothetical protein
MTLTEWIKTETAKRLANEVRCIVCGKPLSDEISRRRGIGPTCLGKSALADDPDLEPEE